MPSNDLILDIKNLRVYFPLDEGVLKAVDGASLSIRKNRTLGIVGESGCGKTATGQSILRIVPRPGKIEGQILFHNEGEIIDLASLPPAGKEMRAVRWREIAMIFQE